MVTMKGDPGMNYRFWLCLSLAILFVAGCGGGDSDGEGENCDNPRFEVSINNSGELAFTVADCHSSSSNVKFSNGVYNNLKQLISGHYEISSACGDFSADVYNLEYDQYGNLENGSYDYNNCSYRMQPDAGDEPANTPPEPENGSVSFSWPDVCQSGGVVTVIAEIYVYDENFGGEPQYGLLSTSDLACSDLQGTLSEISPGTDYAVVLSGLNDLGIKIYHGQQLGVMILPGENTDIGAIQFEKMPDADDDGVPDVQDYCPNTPSGDGVDSYGCTL